MDILINKAKNIRIRSIFGCISFGCSFIFILIGLFLAFFFGTDIEGVLTSGAIVGIVLCVLSSIWLLVAEIITLIDSIIILASKWQNQSLDDDKYIWGILGLLVIGPIANLIFANKALKALTN